MQCKKCSKEVIYIGLLDNRKRNYPKIYECQNGCKDKYGYNYRFTAIKE